MTPNYQCFEQNLIFTFRLTFSWNWPPVFKIVEGRFTAKNYCPVSLLSVFSKSLKNFEKSDRIARAVNRSGATRAVALDLFKAFDRVWHAGLFQKLKSYRILGQIFGLISSFLSNRWLRVVLDRKSSQ